MNRVLMVLAVQSWLIALPPAAYAQRFEVSGGFAWTGGYAAGSGSATETSNPSVSSSPFVLFQTDSRLLAAAGVDARAGVYLTPRLLVGATFSFSRPTLRTHLSADFEGAAPTDADTSVSSYLIGGSVEYQLRAHGWTPFVSGVAGQVRQVPDGGDVLTGVEIRGGGGVRYTLENGRHPLAIRGEVLAAYRTHSVGFDQQHHVVPIAVVAVAWRF